MTILWGKKHTALFQTYNWEKLSFINVLIHVFAKICANTWMEGGGGGGGGHIFPPGPNRVKDLTDSSSTFKLMHFCSLLLTSSCNFGVNC